MNAPRAYDSQQELDQFSENMLLVTERCQRLLRDFMTAHGKESDVLMGTPMSIAQAFAEMMSKLMSDPAKFMEIQVAYYHEYLRLMSSFTARMMGEKMDPIYKPEHHDKRFRHHAWHENMLFDFIKQSYLMTASWMQNTVHNTQGLDDKTLHKLDFYTKQFVDALSPTNFALTNPEVIEATLESKGENLVKGLENLLKDMEEGSGKFYINTTRKEAFEVGKNLAVTSGKVVFQNDLIQLIQYAPTTKDVHQIPVLVISPWINKYYILDMRPENSFVKWLTDKGYTVFITSWVNPDASLAGKNFEHYMLEGAIAAMDAIEKATGEKQVNVIGYCVGGTLMAATLAYLTAKKQQMRVKSVTYLTTLIDFSNSGDLEVFVDDIQLDALEERLKKTGYLDGTEMMTVFSLLRANELIWSFVVRNYMLGKEPFPFDLLYWNSDTTRMTAASHIFYLRNMYLKNQLIKPEGITLAGEKIDLHSIKTPTYMLATEKDHIVPWQASYKGTQVYKGKVRFVLSESGHVAGVVNPPEPYKYGYWVADGLPKKPEDWMKKAKKEKRSWWLDWDEWIQAQGFSGEKVAARLPGKGKLKAIEDAPGSYVKVRYP